MSLYVPSLRHQCCLGASHTTFLPLLFSVELKKHFVYQKSAYLQIVLFIIHVFPNRILYSHHTVKFWISSKNYMTFIYLYYIELLILKNYHRFYKRRK